MSASICRICLVKNVRMHQITGSEVQDVYEKLTNNKIQEDGGLYFACYICYWQLKKCQELVIKSQKSEELLQQIFETSSELNLKSISALDRETYGLVNSLKVTNIAPLQILEYNVTIDTAHQDDTDSDDLMVEYGPDDGAPPNKKAKLDATHNVIQYEAKFIEVNQGTITGTRTYTVANENKSSQIVCDGKSQQILVKTDIKSFLCNDCGKTYESRALLIQHICEHNPMIIKTNETYIKIQKSICDDKFKKRNRSTKNLEKPFKCQYCNYTCTDNSTLKKHIRTHTGENPFKCQYCNYTCTYISTLKRHIRTHTGEKPYKCKYCNYTSTRNHTLKAHFKTHTGEKPFKCQYCKYTCTIKSSLERHIRTHTGEKPYKCPYCSYTSTVNSNLRNHIRNHTGEKPFKCQYCNYTCKQNYYLKRHIQTHTGDKPFKCQYCKYTCTQKGTLKIHIRTHTGEKPYVCEICYKKFAICRTLKVHLRVHMRKES